MKARITIGAILAALFVTLPAQSRDERLHLPLKDALETAAAKSRIDPNVKLYFGEQTFPAPIAKYGTFTANRKTNFANKSDKDACNWAFLAAVLSLQERAKREGGNAVVHIKSVYRKGDFSSATEYECGAGHIMGGVALQGEVVKLK
jgi:hypothetical protein